MEVNPFGTNNGALTVKPQQQNALVEVEQRRAIAEVQAAIMLAKQFPRNPIDAMDRILTACQRPTLAEQALYSYARGGTDITGPSIRLAEAIAQNWGNLQFGIRELSQANGESTVECYAWDVETNTRQVKVFQVPHVRHTRQGRKQLEDPRDIYEAVANQGSRRLRACILGIIPGDVVEAAVKQSEQTLTAKADTSIDAQKKLVEKFADYGVSKGQIEKRIQRHLDAITPAQVVSLRKIYNSMKDGMSSPADWFEVDAEKQPETKVADSLKDKLRNRKPKEVNPTTGEVPITPEEKTEATPSSLPNVDADDDGWPDPPGEAVKPCPECGEVGGHVMSCPNASPPEGE